MANENQDLMISQMIMATQLDGNEMVPFAKDKGNGMFLLSLLKAFINEGLATQASVNGKQNQLIPGEGIEISADNRISVKLDTDLFETVDVLPTSEIKKKIYLVKDPNGDEESNEFIEYLYINGKWEIVGKYSPKVNLTEYMKSEVAEKTFAKKSDVPSIAGLATSEALNVVALDVANLKTTLLTIQNQMKNVLVLPTKDGKIYAVKDGLYVQVADTTENIATTTKDPGE